MGYGYPHVKNEVSRSRLSKVKQQTGQTDEKTEATELMTVPHSWMVVIIMTSKSSAFLSGSYIEAHTFYHSYNRESQLCC